MLRAVVFQIWFIVNRRIYYSDIDNGWFSFIIYKFWKKKEKNLPIFPDTTSKPINHLLCFCDAIINVAFLRKLKIECRRLTCSSSDFIVLILSFWIRYFLSNKLLEKVKSYWRLWRLMVLLSSLTPETRSSECRLWTCFWSRLFSLACTVVFAFSYVAIFEWDELVIKLLLGDSKSTCRTQNKMLFAQSKTTR